FFRFYNFYKRFIKDYKYLAKLLIKLINKSIPFQFKIDYNNIFKILKLAFITVLIFYYSKLELPIYLKTNILDLIYTGALYPITFYLKTINSIELNYIIYNKKILIIVIYLEK
ncbi:uncharacterized protein BDZ83DRAFT_593263, partial [Colletotrichum acutatum]